ncbi:AAA family ATPase [Desulfovibrio sp. OttesenSCG-928-M14]|nr:AAA family ATPase [Desulfovibrio sp. OttesenSCG-928-M14]
MGRRSKIRGVFNAPENIYAQAKTADWLLKSLEQAATWDSYLFECLQWIVGDLRRPLQAVQKEAKKITGKSGIVPARKAAKDALARPQDRLASEFEELYEEHPCLQGIITGIVERECLAVQKLCATPVAPYSSALSRLKQTFGLSKDCQRLCEFVFINQNFSAVEGYFEDRLEVQQYGNRRILAQMLDMKPVRLQICRSELLKCALLDADYSNRLRLKDSLLQFWETDVSGMKELFSRPLSGDALPLESFHVAQDDVAHVRKLMEQDSKKSVHILLYGPSGTGKSTFAYSLAQACGVKAWVVNSREDDGDGDRRASLTACMHVAAKHKGAFVLVDEAERLLDTDMYFGRQTKDKAWLNDFLERPGQRILWITNHVEHIDPAVRRRFSFSIHFDKLGIRERADIWRKVLAKNRIPKRISDEQINALAKNYQVEAAVIHSAVSQAKNIYKGKDKFVKALERVLASQITLQRNGRKQRIKPQAVSDFTLDGVCLEGSAADLVEKCRRVDDALRENTAVRNGCAAMLFYGPPGTGKTALARYLAKELDRECMVKRASDLLSPFVGVAEQNVAKAFRMAERERAVLVIDEADTFLYSRDTAQRSWETSLVNEFLTALEECRGFCICTTNRRESLDAAAMRRFSHKVAFTYAGREQVLALYASLLTPICADSLPPQLERELSALNRLTPGDFHAVRSQYDPLFVDAAKVSHKIFIDALAKEQSLKVEQQTRRIGFGS